MARVYLPCTRQLLAKAVTDGGFGGDPLVAYAVTPDLREWYVEGDLEELEYAAMTHAARASLHLLAAVAHGDVDDPRRFVVAVDVPEGDARPAPQIDRAAVQLTAPVPLAKVAAVHVDSAEAADDVRRAVRALPAAEAGDPDAQFTVEAVEDHELLWFAPQEIGDLV